MERFTASGEAASGTNKTLINLFNPAATPVCRGRIYDLLLGGVSTPAEQIAKFILGRTTAVGTEGSGFTPNNLDPAGPAGAYDAGVAHSAEPTYTANKHLLVFGLHHRAPYRWVPTREGAELVLAATQNNGGGLYTVSSTSTQSYSATVLFME